MSANGPDRYPLPLYELPALRGIAGPTLRPGGLSLTERALALSGLPAGARVLDVGCGLGATVELLRARYGLRAAGVDPAWKLVQQGRRSYPALPLSAGRAEALPCKDETLAALFFECVLSLVPDPERALREARRALLPGGRLLVADLYSRGPVPGPGSRGSSVPGPCCVSGAMSRASIESRLERNGFSVEIWEDHSSALKELAVQAVFAYGSMRAFWTRAFPACDADTLCLHTARLRLGYYILIGVKRS
ncbi:MAG: DVU_1556 family methyltransferase [bacterium]